MSLVDDVTDFLVAQSTAFTLLSGTAGDIGKMVMLDNAHVADTFTSVYETPGSGTEYSFSTSTGTANIVFERPSFQVLSRSTVYTTARSRAQTAYTILDGLAGRNLPTATGTRYLSISAVQPPFFLQRDENERYIVSTNYDTWKQV